MSISVECPSCGKKLIAPDEAAGKRAKCGHRIEVPALPVPTTAALPQPASAPKPSLERLAAATTLPTSRTANEAATFGGLDGQISDWLGRPASKITAVQLVTSEPAEVPTFLPTQQVATPPAIAEPTPPPLPLTDTKPCPFCAELVKIEAKKCKHCGETIDVALRAAEEAHRLAQATQTAQQHALHGISIVNNNSAIAGGQQQPQQPLWNAGTAMLLSFLIPGAGQFYKGQPVSGIVWLLLVIVGYIALVVPGLILHVCCILGAGMGDPYRQSGI